MIYLQVHNYVKQIFEMAKPIPKATPAARGRAIKPASPIKTKEAPSMRNNLKKTKQKPVPLIHVLGFQNSLYIEVYKYTLSENKPGFINTCRKWSRGKEVCDELMEANFIGLKMQPNFALDGNEYLTYDDGFARFWMTRYPLDNESMADKRKEGLCVLKKFFMSTQATNHPPRNIKVLDVTQEAPAVMEKHFLHDNIEVILKAVLDREELKEDFMRSILNLQTLFIWRRNHLIMPKRFLDSLP
jgi:hypothetical protein